MGKSTVLSLFEKCGAVVIDTDETVKSLLKERDVLEKIRGLLGDEVFFEDNGLDTKKVADIVFHSDVRRRALEDILHPLVFERIDLFLGSLGDESKVVLAEVPLLFERGYEGRLDKTITVSAEEETALDRLGKRGISREEALLRLKSQLPIEEKGRRADFVIDNNKSLAQTRSQVEAIYQELLREAEKDGNNTRSRKLR